LIGKKTEYSKPSLFTDSLHAALTKCSKKIISKKENFKNIKCNTSIRIGIKVSKAIE
jgi:hypothetical protein